MRMLLLYILFALLSQQTTVNCQQTPFLESENLKNSESEKGCEQRAMSNEQKSPNAQGSQLEAQCLKKTVDYYENQIRLADSLYKNYLPQYNFEEVKAAVMFFDSLRLTTDNSQRTTDFFHRILTNKKQHKTCTVPEPVEGTISGASTSSATAYPRTVDCCPLTVDIEYQRARSHYYHAVGLTERDDIVGACEHYFIALEIMESETENLKTSESEKRLKISQFFSFSDSQILNNPEDYEKIRFLSLIYTRLGELFLSENYCDLAISKYRKALRYVLLLGENKAVANTYKCLGNSYHLYDMPDSALYYYNMSIKTDSNLTNRLDVEKSIAKILFNKGEKDKAYILLKNNLNKLDNYIAKDSYYVTLGEMYYSDLIYDSATYFLKISSNSNNYSIKATSLGLLSTIHDSIGNQIEKAACDNILSKILLKSSNKTIHSSQLQSAYDEYKERKYEREKLEKNRKTYMTLLMFAFFIVFTFVILLFLWYIYKRRSEILMTTILDNENLIIRINEDIKQKEIEIERLSEDNLNKGKVIDDYIENIEKTTTEINELKKDVNEKEIWIGELLENIKAKDEQISNYKEQTINAIKADINSYYETEICEKILLEVKYKNTNKVKKITLNKLKPKEIVSLKYAANSTLNHLLNKITSNYRKIDNEDLICICMLLLDISITDISELMGKSYNAVWTRITKIKNTFKLDADSNLQSFLLGLL